MKLSIKQQVAAVVADAKDGLRRKEIIAAVVERFGSKAGSVPGAITRAKKEQLIQHNGDTYTVNADDQDAPEQAPAPEAEQTPEPGAGLPEPTPLREATEEEREWLEGAVKQLRRNGIHAFDAAPATKREGPGPLAVYGGWPTPKPKPKPKPKSRIHSDWRETIAASACPWIQMELPLWAANSLPNTWGCA